MSEPRRRHISESRQRELEQRKQEMLQKQDEWFRQFKKENRQRAREGDWEYLKAQFVVWGILLGLILLALFLFT